MWYFFFPLVNGDEFTRLIIQTHLSFFCLVRMPLFNILRSRGFPILSKCLPIIFHRDLRIRREHRIDRYQKLCKLSLPASRFPDFIQRFIFNPER